jgi:subfamily B ATP-binding cassette protein MsbA
MEYKKSFLPSLSEFLGMAIVGFVLMFGGSQIIENQISLSASVFMTYILLFSQSIVPIKNITRSVGNVQRSFSAAERIFNVLKTNTENTKNKIHISKIKEGIKIHNLSFAYNDGENILKSVNMEIKKGEKVLLTGKSGSGKSTLLNILSGLQQNYQGNIFIDDEEFKNCDKKDWYKIIGFCNQKQFIIHDTVLNNLTLGKEIELGKIINLSTILDTHEFISTMKNGYDTVLTKDDNFLSGGQIQRICLLRTLLKNSEFLILDEPTSALDYETEKKIIDFLLNTDKTIIMVAHNMENFKCFDKMYSIDNGLCVKL